MAGICAYSLVNLLPGGRTNITGNTADRGGAAVLVNTTLIVQPGHILTAMHNAAKSHGGAIAMLAGASLAVLEGTSCTKSECPSSKRGSGSCDIECMSIACNWDGGDCVDQRIEAAGAGSEAGQVCDFTAAAMDVTTAVEDTAAVLEHYPACGDIPLR
jgi:hypothetical protein